MSLVIYLKVHPEIFERLERFFNRLGWRLPLTMTNALAEASTSGNDMQRKKEFISEMRRSEAEEVRHA